LVSSTAFRAFCFLFFSTKVFACSKFFHGFCVFFLSASHFDFLIMLLYLKLNHQVIFIVLIIISFFKIRIFPTNLLRPLYPLLSFARVIFMCPLPNPCVCHRFRLCVGRRGSFVLLPLLVLTHCTSRISLARAQWIVVELWPY
jgi:hypothetical protein